MHNIRIIYQKNGRLKYISHLDIMRLMQRALKRSGLPVWYTEGFNPHIYLTFALPLALGLESNCEIMDFRLKEEIEYDEIVQRLNLVLPQGLNVLSAAEPLQKITEIESADYQISFPDSCGYLKDFPEFLSQKEILIEKKTKKGISTVDLKPQIQLLELSEEKCVLRLPAGPVKNISPLLVLEAYQRYCHDVAAFPQVVRIAVNNRQGNAFR